jgi:hypothetical protein
VTALARPGNNCTSKLQTHPLVREGVKHQETHNCQTEKKNLVISSRWEPNIKTDQPTARRSQLNFNFSIISTEFICNAYAVHCIYDLPQLISSLPSQCLSVLPLVEGLSVTKTENTLNVTAANA